MTNAKKILLTVAGAIEFILPNPRNIPSKLKDLPFAYWIAEHRNDGQGNYAYKKNGKASIGKAPVNLNAAKISKLELDQWMPFGPCIEGFDAEKFFGYGPLLRAADGIVGIDLDDYDDLVSTTPKIAQLMTHAEQKGIYCEVSPSGSGRRLFAKATLPKGKGRRKGGIELYSDTAFLTLTGAICWHGDVVEGQWLVDEFLDLIATSTPLSKSSARVEESSGNHVDCNMVDKIAQIVAAKYPKLWCGDWQSDGNTRNPEYPSQSEADFALCGHIMRTAAEQRIARSDFYGVVYSVFARSGLYRSEKDATLAKYTIPNMLATIGEPVEREARSWVEPKPLPSPLRPASKLDMTLVPDTLKAFIENVALRMQVPPEIILTPLIISFGSVIGKQVAIQPHASDPSWTEYPNFWGAAILEPGMLKSPALNQASKFINELDAAARNKYLNEMDRWKSDEDLRRIVHKDDEKEIKKLLKAGRYQEAHDLAKKSKANEPPIRKRYIITDATPEARLRILSENPQGIMLIRDELSGHIENLHRDGYEQARAQELQFYDGKMDYEDDRVKREGLYAHAPRMALYGNLQPSKIERLLFDRSKSARGRDDGYIERLLQLAVMPILSREYKVSKFDPDTKAENRVRKLFQQADGLRAHAADGDATPSGPRIVTFSPVAEELLDTWLTALETALRDPSDRSPMKSHTGKYRGTVVKLALVVELCGDINAKTVSEQSLVNALKLGLFYRDHAARIYGLGEPCDVASAHELLGRIESGLIKDGFAPRDVQMRKLRRLESLGEVEGALSILQMHGIVKVEEHRPATGRPSTKVYVHPSILAKVKVNAA